MLLGVVFLLVVLTVPLAGGRLSRVGELSLRAPWLALVAIGLQIAIVSVLPGGSVALHETIHIGSYALLGACAWLNRRIPGVWLVAAGGLLNAIVIVANGGVMPADPALIVEAAQRGGEGFVNSGVVASPHLLFLGDIIATPRSWPMANVYSVGDCVILLGVIVLLHRVSASRLLRWWPARHPAVA
jgi:hypothetical protein